MSDRPKGRIFINYRRGEDSAAAGRLYDRLEQQFGRAALFMDVDDIAAGDDFVAILEKQVSACDVFLAVIGRSWLEARDAAGGRRLDNPKDFVRIEIASALRLGKHVIPVLVNEGRMPSADTLPEPLKLLARRNAVRLTHERFKADVQGLLNGIETALAKAKSERAARTEAERQAAEEARKKREAEQAARAAELERAAKARAEAGLSTGEIRKAEELANWDFIKDSANPDKFRDHLARFDGGPTSRYARKKLEGLLWALPVTRSSIESLRKFIEEFPEGDNAVEAQAELSALEGAAGAARQAEEKKRAETDFWAKVAASTQIGDFDAFLKQWPDGAHAKDAKARIKELRGGGFTRRGVLKGFGIGAAVTAVAAGTLYSAITPAEFLWRQINDRSTRTFPGHSTGHASWVGSVAFSPDGRTALSGGNGNTLKLWDVATGKELRTFTERSTPVYSVAFSPDGRAALSGSNDGTLKLWDVATGKKLRNFTGHSYGAYSVAFSRDGRTALSGGNDNTLKLWDVATAKELRTFTGHSSAVYSVALSPDGHAALSGSNDGTMKLWDVATGKELRNFTRHSNAVWSVAFSPDGRTALSGSNDHTLKLWDVATAKELRTFTGHSSAVYSVAFSPDGRTALSGSNDHTMKLWDVATAKDLRTFTGHSSWVGSVAFSRDGRTALSGGNDHTMKLWDVSPYLAAAAGR